VTGSEKLARKVTGSKPEGRAGELAGLNLGPNHP